MPIYEYQCKQCQHKFDALQKFSDEPLKDCPECKQPELEKAPISGGHGILFLGTGWTDNGMSVSRKN
jgi:putative FmdB family regulatory protein